MYIIFKLPHQMTVFHDEFERIQTWDLSKPAAMQCWIILLLVTKYHDANWKVSVNN